MSVLEEMIPRALARLKQFGAAQRVSSAPFQPGCAALPRLVLLLGGMLLILAPGAHAQKLDGAISGQTVYSLTHQFLAAAPHRSLNSPGHAQAEAFIKSQFGPEAAKGDFETDAFTASTPIGLVDMRNYVVKYPGKKSGIIILASHYETNYWLKDIDFRGANDGAATSALLIAIGHYLRQHPPTGYSVWLLFDDGEESIETQWTNSNSLYGTRHIAAKWSNDGTLPKIKAFLLADMIGDKDLNILDETSSTPWLRTMLKQAAAETHHSANVAKSEGAELDDHQPFLQRNVPALDIIDVDYGPRTATMPDGYHHTAEDTIDKVSAKSLGISADLFLEMIRLIDQRP